MTTTNDQTRQPCDVANDDQRANRRSRAGDYTAHGKALSSQVTQAAILAQLKQLDAQTQTQLQPFLID